jgi:hypothetical protein
MLAADAPASNENPMFHQARFGAQKEFFPALVSRDATSDGLTPSSLSK